MRVAALEDNVAFLEEWCEEQQDALDRAVGPVAYDYELDAEAGPPPRAVLRVVDLRDTPPADEDDDDDGEAEAGVIVALVETEHDRRVRQLRLQLNRLRTRLAATLAPGAEPRPAAERRPPTQSRIESGRKISAKPAGRTAP